jgi:hypothetical protein
MTRQNNALETMSYLSRIDHGLEHVPKNLLALFSRSNNKRSKYKCAGGERPALSTSKTPEADKALPTGLARKASPISPLVNGHSSGGPAPIHRRRRT